MNRPLSSPRRPPVLPIALLLVSIVLISVAACGRDDSPAREATAQHTPTKIDWYQGDVDDAFTYAKSAGKPLFLYWGAEWCPPCHYLKKKIFTRPEFVARMQDFVPVYLDGDTARAQLLGEALDVKGYPTVLIFDPLGQEVMRMPSTVPVEQYESVLDSAIASMKPVKTVLAGVLEVGPEAATQSDLNLLAFYSWGQDSQVDLDLDQRVEAFSRLYRETPASLQVEKSRFLGLYLVALAQQSHVSETETPSQSDAERAAAHEGVLQVLSDTTLRNANLLWVEYYAQPIVDFLQPDDTPEREELLGAWQQAAIAMEADTTLSVDDRLSATHLRIKLVKLAAHPEAEDAPIPSSLQDHVRSQVAWAIEAVTDESELQTVVNTMAYLLESAGLSEEAETMLLSKMHETAAPYYFMSWIAGLREDAGDTEGALEWHRKAYDSAEGRYSRFRWGSTYLRRLMALSPESSERIEADSVEVLSELLTHEDAFAGGNYSRLDSLQGAYWSWNEEGDHDPELARIRDYVQASCERYAVTPEDSQLERCKSFLDPEEVEGDAAM